MLSKSIFGSELYLPIFGYGAKTFKESTETAQLFPMSLNIGCPIIPNQKKIIDDTYNKCL